MVGGQPHAPAALPPERRRGTHYIGKLGGPQSQSGRVWKISPPPLGFDPNSRSSSSSSSSSSGSGGCRSSSSNNNINLCSRKVALEKSA